MLVCKFIGAPNTPSRSRADDHKTFKFSSLPTELRLLIWRETFEPRILQITSKTVGCSCDGYRGPFYIYIRFRARGCKLPPVALEVCRESRALALKHYIPSFHSVTRPRGYEMEQTAVYFNPQLDTVCVEWYCGQFETLLQNTNKETIRSIKTLMIEDDRLWTDMACIAGMLSHFESLETLILVVHEEGRQRYIQVDMKQRLVEAKDYLIFFQERSKEWKLPAVKVLSKDSL